MNEDSIIRVEHDSENPYIMVSRSMAQQRGLSFEARGVLLYLLSKPNDWQVQPKDIQAEGEIGRDQCNRILGELEEYGYLEVERETGKANDYTVHERPFQTSRVFSDGNPVTGNPTHTYKREQKKEDKSTGSRARRDLLRQITSNADTVVPPETQSKILMESIAKSALAEYVSLVFGKSFTIDKATANAMSSKVTVKTNAVHVVYPAPIDMYDSVPAFKRFVEVRCASLKAVPNMTPLNAMKNLCKIGFNPYEIPGNEKKMPGYHVWLQKNQAVVSQPETIVEDLGVPDEE